MEEVQKDISAPALVHAIEANLFEYFLLFSRWPGAEIHDDPEMLWMITNIPFPLFNSVLRAQLAADEIDTVIEAAITRCEERNVPMLWQVGPATKPAKLGEYLHAHGFYHEGGSPGMAVDLQSLNERISKPSGFTIQRVNDAESMEKWNHVLITGFDMPDFIADAFLDIYSNIGFDAQLPIHNYLGLMNGEPVASSSMFLGAGVAGIYNVSTLPEARRQGFGALITLIPLLKARSRGYRVGVLQSSEMGYKVYRQLGFQEYCKISHYVWSPESMQGAR